MAQESLILAFQLLQNVTGSVHREVGAQVPQGEKLITAYGTECNPVYMSLTR